MNGRASPSGLFGIVGGLLWGSSRNSAPNDAMEEEVAAFAAEENTRYSEGTSLQVPDESNTSEKDVSEKYEENEEEHDEEVDGDDDSSHSSSELPDRNEGHDDSGLTYEGELVSEMSYRTMQKHLKAMGIKCTGKKEALLESLHAAVQSGAADRLVSLRHSSPLHPYPHESRTPKRKRLSSPRGSSPSMHSPPSTSRSTRSRKETGRKTRNSTKLVDVDENSRTLSRNARVPRRLEESTPLANKRDDSKKVKSSVKSLPKKNPPTQSQDHFEPNPSPSSVEPKRARKESKSPVALASAMKQHIAAPSPIVNSDCNSETYFSSEECSPGHRSSPPIVINTDNTAPLSALPPGLVSSKSIDLGNLSSASVCESEYLGTEYVTDTASIINETASVAATTGGSVAGDDLDNSLSSNAHIDLSGLPPPQEYPRYMKIHSTSSQGYHPSDDDRSSIASVADVPRRSNLSAGTFRPSPPATAPDALEALGSKFVAALRGEQTMSDAEIAFYKGLLEGVRSGSRKNETRSSSPMSEMVSASNLGVSAATSESPKNVPVAIGTKSHASTDGAAQIGVETSPEDFGKENQPIISFDRRREPLTDLRERDRSFPYDRKRSVEDAELGMRGDQHRASSGSRLSEDGNDGDDDESYSQQGRFKRQYVGEPFEPPQPVWYGDAWRGSYGEPPSEVRVDRDRYSMSSNSSFYFPEQVPTGRYHQQPFHEKEPPQWQQDREWMAPRRYSFMPPQHQQQQQPPSRYSTSGQTSSMYTPRFQENVSRATFSEGRGYGQPASSGMVPVSLQVQQQRSMTPGLSSVQRRLMKRRLASAGSTGGDGSYSGGYGSTKAATATASGAVAKKILDTLGDITSSLDDQRRRPLPVATTSSLALQEKGGAATKNSVRFSESTPADSTSSSKKGFVATPEAGDNSSKSIRNRKGTPHDSNVIFTSTVSSIASSHDDYDDKRSSTSSDQLWSRERGRSGGPSMSPPPPTQSSRTTLTISRADPNDSDNEFQFGSPTRIEGLDDDDTSSSQILKDKKSSVRFAFSPPGKKKSDRQKVPLTPGVALKSNSGSGAASSSTPSVAKMAALSSAKSESDDENASAAARPKTSGFAESIWKRPNTVQCQACLVYNDKDAVKCVSCESKMGTPADTSRRPTGAAPAASTSTDKPATSGFAESIWKRPNTVQCQACLVYNDKDAVKCVSCESKMGTPADTSRRPTGAAPAASTSTDKPPTSGFGSGPKPTATLAAKSGFSFGAPKPATSESVSDTSFVASSKPAVSLGAASSGFKFGASKNEESAADKDTSAQVKEAEDKDKDKNTAAPSIPPKPSFGFSTSATKPAAAPIVLGEAKKFSGFGFSKKTEDGNDADKSKAASSPANTLAAPPAPAKPAPSFTFSSKKSDDADTTTAPGSKSSFGIISSKSSEDAVASKPASLAFGNSASAVDFSKKISPSSGGFSLGSKRSSEADATPVEASGGRDDDDNEDRVHKKRVNTSDDSTTEKPPTISSSGFAFGKTTTSFGSSTFTAAKPSSVDAKTVTKPSFGFASRSGETDAPKDTPAPISKTVSGGFAFGSVKSTDSSTPAAATSTSFKFGGGAASSTPLAVTGPFGAKPAALTSVPSVSGPFGAKPSLAVSGPFGASSSNITTASAGSSFKFNAAAATSNFKFNPVKTTAETTVPAVTPSSGFGGFGGFGASSSNVKETVPPPPYGSESPGSTMDTGYASGDASNMSTGALPPVAGQPTSFGSSSFGGSGSFGGFGGGATANSSTSLKPPNSFGTSSGFNMGAASKPASFGGSSFGGVSGGNSSFSFNSSGGGGGASFGGGGGGGIAFGQSSMGGASAAAPSMGGGAGGFSLGAADKSKGGPAGRRKLKAKKFT